MLSEIRQQWREDVREAYSRARERLNEKFAGETVRATHGKWTHPAPPLSEEGKRIPEVVVDVEEVHILDRGNRGERFEIVLETESDDDRPIGVQVEDPEAKTALHSPENIEVVS